jgi:GxxExxY protein
MYVISRNMHPETHEKVLYKQESFNIQGAVFEVYKEMGSGFLENVYQECLEREFIARKIPFQAQRDISVRYKGVPLKQFYKADFICYESIVLELKAVKDVAPEHKAQLFNYLKATQLRLGLLINFGYFPKAQIIRIII